MAQRLTIPLWMPVAALAIVLFVVGWSRGPRAQPVESPQPAIEHTGELASASAAVAPARTATSVSSSASMEAANPVRGVAVDVLPPTILVHGRFHDASGATVPDAWVQWTDAQGHAASVNQSEGNYIAGGLTPGLWTAHIAGQGVAPSSETIELSSPLVVHDFVIAVRTSVPVCLRTPSGDELYGALRSRKVDMFVIARLSLVATKESPPSQWTPTGLNQLPANQCGAFKLDHSSSEIAMPEGCYGTFEFRAPPPLWINIALGHVLVQSMRIDSIPERLELTVDPAAIERLTASVSLRAVDPESGTALSDVRATIGTLQRAGLALTAEAGGRLAIQGIAPGAYGLRIMASGRCHVIRQIVLGPGEQLDLGDIPLPRIRPFRVHIEDSQGKPVAIEFTLDALVPGDPRATARRYENIMYRSQADGMADLSWVAPGKWVLRMLSRGRSPTSSSDGAGFCLRPQVIDTSSVDGPEATVRLERSSQLVLTPHSEGERGLTFWVDTSDGLPAWSSSFYDSSPRILDLAPGDYTLTVVDEDGSEVLQRSFTLGASSLGIDVSR